MGNREWYCHSCDHTAASLSAARRHSKEAGPVIRKGKQMRHLLTQNQALALADRESSK